MPRRGVQVVAYHRFGLGGEVIYLVDDENYEEEERRENDAWTEEGEGGSSLHRHCRAGLMNGMVVDR